MMRNPIIYKGKTAKEWAAIRGLSVGHARRWIKKLQEASERGGE
jgi:hypothetical protein